MHQDMPPFFSKNMHAIRLLLYFSTVLLVIINPHFPVFLIIKFFSILIALYVAYRLFTLKRSHYWHYKILDALCIFILFIQLSYVVWSYIM